MANDPVLRMLGLARRAGKLAYGDELVREVCFAHKARCVFLAGDAGASTAKKGAFYAEKANVPCVQLPHGKIELGTAVGKSGCAIVAVTDIGLASSAVEKLASEHEEYAETAKLLSEKNARIQSRKGIKKQKNKAETETEKPDEPEKREESRPKPAEKRPFRKADGEKRPYRKDGERPSAGRTAKSARTARTASVPSARRTAKSARTARTVSVPSAGRTAKSVRTARTASAPFARRTAKNARTVRTASVPSAATAHGNRILQAKNAASAIKRNERAKARIQ